MIRTLVLTLLLLTPACGAGSGGSATPEECAVGEHQIRIVIADIDKHAQTTRDASCNSLIEVATSAHESDWVELLIHEYWHAVGYSNHLPDPCYANQFVLPEYPDLPCSAELEAMQQAASGSYVITTVPELAAAAQTAALFWNDRTHSTMFVVLP